MAAGFELLRRRYGAMWVGALRAAGWGGVHEAAAHWAAELADIPPAVLAIAFEGWREPGPPNLMELHGRCVPHLRIRPEHRLAQALPAPAPSAAQRAAVRALLAELRGVLR